MTEASIHEDLAEIVRKMMGKEGVTSYELKIRGKSEDGENYLGEIVYFDILSKNGTKIHELVMKTGKRSEKLRETMPIDHIYNRELLMYSRVFPEFRRFLKNINAKFEFDFVPKVHWIAEDLNRETLIFTDLRSEGFKLRDRKEPWNLDHILFVMEHYGKYHALSLALRDQRPEIFLELIGKMPNLGLEFKKTMDLDDFYNAPFQKVMDLLKKNGREDLVKKYDGFVESIVPIALGNSAADDKIVITHGDCWNNNFMFKYKDSDETKPWKMRFLDFQLTSLDSPILDLSYNIYVSCDKSCLNHLDLILDTYYKSLSSNVKVLGSDPEHLFPHERFKRHWKKYSKFGVLLSTVMLKVLLTAKEHAPDIVKNSEEGKSVAEFFQFVMSDEEEYNRRVFDVFTFYGDNFL